MCFLPDFLRDWYHGKSQFVTTIEMLFGVFSEASKGRKSKSTTNNCQVGGVKYVHPDPSKNHPNFDLRILFSHEKRKTPPFSQPEIKVYPFL